MGVMDETEDSSLFVKRFFGELKEKEVPFRCVENL